MNQLRPRHVSIGLPTRNGERYIAEAVRSLLDQDHREFDIVVADNASTDRTADIVHGLERRDSRVRHERVDEPLTAAQNFNRAFDLTDGPSFMWAADDDRWDPAYVRRCLAALDRHPTAVMATSGLRFIDPGGTVIDADYARYDNPDLSSASTIERVRQLLRRGGWYQVYGLARREALERTRLFQDVYGPDVVLTLELAMAGPILRVPEVLFWYRRFPDRTEAARAARQGGIRDETEIMSTPSTHLQESLSDAVRASALSPALKLRLLAEILEAFYVDDTPLRSKARPEARRRARSAAHDRDVARFVKFSLADGLGRISDLSVVGRRLARRAGRKLPRR
jgi:Glycosyl transferase family 2